MEAVAATPASMTQRASAPRTSTSVKPWVRGWKDGAWGRGMAGSFVAWTLCDNATGLQEGNGNRGVEPLAESPTVGGEWRG